MINSVSAEAVITIRHDVPSVQLDGETVLFHAAKGKYVGLDDIGSDIWQRLRTPMTVRELCTQLAMTYDGPAQQIEQDVRAFLGRLTEAELIDITP